MTEIASYQGNVNSLKAICYSVAYLLNLTMEYLFTT